jgi:hydrogenase nickel incorporation protein HypA/HybF
MHEVGLMQTILDTAIACAQQVNAQQITVILLRVGEASGVVSDSLELAFEVVKKGTIAETAQLLVENVPTLCYCATCNLEFHPDDLFYECPDCHQPNTEIRQGKEFELTSLEVS